VLGPPLGTALGEALGDALGEELGLALGETLGVALGAPLGHRVQIAVMLKSPMPKSPVATNPTVRCPLSRYQLGGITTLTMLFVIPSPTIDTQTSPRKPSFSASTCSDRNDPTSK
jgi:hypothetical protein